MPATKRKEAKAATPTVTDSKEAKTNNADQKKDTKSKLLPIFILAVTIAVGAYAHSRNLDNVDNLDNSDIPVVPVDDVRSQDKYRDESKRPAVGTGSATNADLTNVIANGGRIFTTSELKQYTGEDPDKPIYLAILGQVFDVTKGKEHYGKGGGYGFFSGRDGTRAFVTGDFTEKGTVYSYE